MGMRLKHIHMLWISLIFAGVGALDYQFNAKPLIDEDILNGKYKFTGVIEDVNILADGDRFKVKIYTIRNENDKPIGCKNLKFLLKTNGYVGNKGDIISFQATPKTFDYIGRGKEYALRMKHQGITYYSNLKYDAIKKIGVEASPPQFLNNIKEKISSNIERSSLGRESADFLISILLGDKSFLTSETKAILSSAGLSHILALSGMHVAIVYSIILALLFPFSFIGGHKIRQIIALLLIWIYVFLTGGSPSTVRAAIMASFMVLAFLLERKHSALNALLAAIIFILIIDPLALWNVGLQFSFLCVASILIFVERLNPVDRHSHPNSFKILNLILISLFTTICTWTLMAYYFQAVPILFLPANLVLLPLLPLFVGMGIIYVLFLCLGLEISIIGQLLDIYHRAFTSTSDFLSLNGSALVSFQLPALSVWMWLFGIAGIAYVLHSSGKKKRRFVTCLAIFAFISSIAIGLDTPRLNNTSLEFKHSFTKCEVNLYQNGKLQIMEFPRQTVSNTTHGLFQILSVDCPLHHDSLNKFSSFLNKDKKFLIIGPSANISQMAEMIAEFNFERVILHTGVGKNKKVELLHLLDESLWEKIYSLRENGSLDFDL